MQQGEQTDATCNIQQCWELLANNVHVAFFFFARGLSGTLVIERDFRTKTFYCGMLIKLACVEPIQLAKKLYLIFIVLLSHYDISMF